MCFTHAVLATKEKVKLNSSQLLHFLTQLSFTRHLSLRERFVRDLLHCSLPLSCSKIQPSVTPLLGCHLTSFVPGPPHPVKQSRDSSRRVQRSSVQVTGSVSFRQSILSCEPMVWIFSLTVTDMYRIDSVLWVIVQRVHCMYLMNAGIRDVVLFCLQGGKQIWVKLTNSRF